VSPPPAPSRLPVRRHAGERSTDSERNIVENFLRKFYLSMIFINIFAK